MVNLELFQEKENGQLIVNWDSLELLTSSSFVAEVKESVDRLGEEIFFIQNLHNTFISVYTVSIAGLYQIYRYDRKQQQASFQCIVSHELEIINNHRRKQVQS